MKIYLSLISAATLAALPSQAQVTITAADMYNEVGLTYSTYANAFDPFDPSTTYPVASLIGASGGPRFWDFTTGPTNKIFQFDYLSPVGLFEAADFPLATIAERKTTIGDPGEVSWLFFEQVPGTGRKVYGFYDEAFSPPQPSNPFSTPIIDFPDQINLNDTWTTSMTVTTEIGVGVPGGEDEEDGGGGFFSFPAQFTFTSNFKADAWGIVDLPDLGFGDALRINEEQTIDVAVDLDGEGQYQRIETDYTRNYYWLRPGYGIVAQINSAQSSSPPPANFDRATAFLRMFKTNKKAQAGCTDPQPVTDLRISLSDGKVLLKWTKTQCAREYRVEHTATPNLSASWQLLGAVTTENFMLDLNISQNSARFYRVVSLR